MDINEFIAQWKDVPKIHTEDSVICRMVYLTTGDGVFATDYKIEEDKTDNYYDEVKLYYHKSVVAIIRLANIKHVVFVFRE